MITEMRKINENSVIFTFVVLSTISSLTICLGQFSSDADDDDDDDYWAIQRPVPLTQRPTWILYSSETELQPNSHISQISNDIDKESKSILPQLLFTSTDNSEDADNAILTVTSNITGFVGHADDDHIVPAENNSSRYVISDRTSSDGERINEAHNFTNSNSNEAKESTSLKSVLKDSFNPVEQTGEARSSPLSNNYRTNKVLDQKKINFLNNVFGIKVTNSQKISEDFSQINGGKLEQATHAEPATQTSLGLNKTDFQRKVLKTPEPLEAVEQSVDVAKVFTGYVSTTKLHPKEQGAKIISEDSKSEDNKELSAAYDDENEDKYKHEQHDKEDNSQLGILKAEYPLGSKNEDSSSDHDRKGHLNKEPEDNNCSGFLRFHRDSRCKKNFSLVGLGFVGILAISFLFVFILFFCVCKGCRCVQIYLRRRHRSYVPLSTKE